MLCIAKYYQTTHCLEGETSRCGFTLLELIGVMVVIAILAAALLPGTINLIQVQRSVNEGSELPKIAEALKRGMLREQVFPIYANGDTLLTDGSDGYWWNLAARHGGGSANEVRHPLGVRPDSENTRQLYFADSSWGSDTLDGLLGNGVSFNAITGSGFPKVNPTNPSSPASGWISPENPYELRLLLVSTTSSDLPLPDTLNESQFNALWDDWAVSSSGNPAIGSWSNYGLNSGNWSGRAPELNVERIDLRDLLSTVIIENRRAIFESSGTRFDPSDVPGLSGYWKPTSLYAYSVNLVSDEVLIITTPASTVGSPPVEVVEIQEVILAKRGRVVDDYLDPEIVVSGQKVSTATPITFTSTDVTIPLNFVNRANTLAISGWANLDDYIQNRYFLSGQELRLFEPWNGQAIGIFTVEKVFSTLRFNGLQWRY